MWIKKTSEELAEKHVSKSFLTFLGFYILIFLILFVGSKYFGEMSSIRYAPPSPLKWKEVIEKIPGLLFLSFLITIIATLFDLIYKKKTKPTYLCDKCNKYKKDKDFDLCECGGKFVSIDVMRWVDY